MLSDNEKAAAAERLLHDPTFLATFSSIEQEAVETIKASGPEQQDVREQAYHKIKAVEAILDELKGHLTQRQLNERR